MADRMLTGSLWPPFAKPRFVDQRKWDEFRSTEEQGVTDALRRAPIIVADNVAAYTKEHSGYVLEESFPCLAPPWPIFWVEYPNTSGRERRGVLIEDVTTAPEAPNGSFEEARKDARDNGYDGEIRWLIDLGLFIESQRHNLYGPMGWLVLALDPLGRVVGNRWSLNTQGGAAVIDEIATLSGAEKPEEWLIGVFLPALQTLAFLHCKNLVTTSHQPEERLSKAHRRRHGQPLLRYKTIALDVPRAGRRGERGEGQGSAQAVHIRPGEFRHYGDCCPGVHEAHGLLFGKQEGIYWVPQHLRGNPQRGVNVNDYEIADVRE